VEAHFGPFRDSANLDEFRGLHQMYQGLEINLDAPDGTPRCVRHVKSCVCLFGDSANLDTR
jgi:hypothetical protein